MFGYLQQPPLRERGLGGVEAVPGKEAAVKYLQAAQQPRFCSCSVSFHHDPRETLSHVC